MRPMAGGWGWEELDEVEGGSWTRAHLPIFQTPRLEPSGLQPVPRLGRDLVATWSRPGRVQVATWACPSRDPVRDLVATKS